MYVCVCAMISQSFVSGLLRDHVTGHLACDGSQDCCGGRASPCQAAASPSTPRCGASRRRPRRSAVAFQAGRTARSRSRTAKAGAAAPQRTAAQSTAAQQLQPSRRLRQDRRTMVTASRRSPAAAAPGCRTGCAGRWCPSTPMSAQVGSTGPQHIHLFGRCNDEQVQLQSV
jgi:hypothetical protein